MKNSLLFLLVIGPLLTFAQLTPKSVKNGKGIIGFYEFKPYGYNPDSTYNYPLIIFMHGIGERGNGTSELPMSLNSSFPKLLVKGATMNFTIRGKQHAFLVLIPQMTKEYNNWQNFYVDAMINYATENLKVDTNKIFLTGWSLGGGGAWKYATTSGEAAKRLAGIIPVSAAPDYTDLCNITRNKVAVWAHHARDDSSVPLHYTEDAITAINECSPEIPAIITYYPSGGHPYVGDWAYDTLNRIEYPNVYQWMAGTSRINTKAANLDPVVDAGIDTVVVLPATSTTLNGGHSYDPNDVIVKYTWSLKAGPASPRLNILKPDFPQTVVSGLEPGNYIFSLTVTDQFGVSKADEVTINIILPAKGENAVPVADAGSDVNTRSDNYLITGNGRDFDGTIKGFNWRQISGPELITIEKYGTLAQLWGMKEEGIYGIELEVNDDHNPSGTARDTVYIQKDPPIPGYPFYLTKKNPLVKQPYFIRYDILALLFVVFCIPTFIFNSFIHKYLSYQIHNPIH